MLKRFIALFMAVMAVAIHADYLDEGFAAPPMQAKPQTWWHWLDYNISKEGIKADIDAIRASQTAISKPFHLNGLRWSSMSSNARRRTAWRSASTTVRAGRPAAVHGSRRRTP